MKLAPLVSFALLAFPALASAQGTLTPPSAAPAPSMRSLDQIEPRRPLGTPNQLNTATLVISAPGSYVLQGNVTVAAGDAIQIRADDVTLNLNGFTIASTAGTAEGCGIRLGGTTATARRARLRNGRIYSPGYTFESGPPSVFTGGGFAQAVAPDHADACSDVLVEEVQISSGQGGIDAGPDSTVSDCMVRFVSSFAIRATTVRDSVVAMAGGPGIEATTVLRCQSETVGAEPAIRATTVTASTGICSTFDPFSGGGIIASGTATDSFGSDGTYDGVGLAAADAIRCFGSSTGTGIKVSNTARFCFGDGSTDTAIVGPTFIGCWYNYGTLPTTRTRYLMPDAAP